MDRDEACAIADAVVAELRDIPHAVLVQRLLDEIETREVTGPSGASYQVEIQGMWDARPRGALRVIVGVDDGSFRGAFRPVDRDLLVEPAEAARP